MGCHTNRPRVEYGLREEHGTKYVAQGDWRPAAPLVLVRYGRARTVARPRAGTRGSESETEMILLFWRVVQLRKHRSREFGLGGAGSLVRCLSKQCEGE